MDHLLFKDIAISDAGFIFNPITGESFSVNTVGVSVLNYLREGKTIQEITDHLTSEYSIEKEMAERDIQDFINLLKLYKLTNDRKES